jgi:HPt (histidine-containing phosphotransfer) domain-containing protein
MTANAMQGDRELCLAAGMDDYVTKPIRVEELAAALRRAQPRVEDAAEPQAAVAVAQTAGAAASAEPPGPDAVIARVIDHRALDQLQAAIGGRRELLYELIDSYLADAPPLLAELGVAVEKGDAPRLRRAAHTLKSNSADMGATELARLCARLEALGKAGSLDGTAALAAQAETEFARARAELEALRLGATV